MSKTILLDRTFWTPVLDSNGDIAIASDPYATAQDVACACKTFLGECYVDETIGVPYWESILGQVPSLSFIKDGLKKEAERIKNVDKATVFIESSAQNRQERILGGQIQCTLKDGSVIGVSI